MLEQADEKATNTSDKDLVKLAGYNAYNPYKTDDEFWVNGIKYKVINTHYYDPSGLDAITVQKVDTKELTIVYVGTQLNKEDGLKDGINDLELLGDVPPAQLIAAEKYLETMEDKYGNDGYKIKSSCGNSLAGAIVCYIGIKHPEIKAVTLNPAMLPAGVVKHGQDYSNITNYYSIYDPLTLAIKAGNLDSRVPGAHYTINNGIPEILIKDGKLDFSKLISNHMGYNSNQYYSIDGKGQIYIAADDHIVTSIWNGLPLYGGPSKHVKINKYELEQLVAAINNEIIGVQYSRASSYLTNSKEIVDDEERKITQRIAKLQAEFELAFEDLAGNPLFKGIAKASNRLSSEIDHLITLLDSAERTSKSVNGILNSAPGKIAEYVVCNTIAEFAFAEARRHLGNLSHKVRELSNLVNYILDRLIPELFKGAANKYKDAVVNELQAHFEIILRNKDKVNQQILEFKQQVQDTADSFYKLDENLGNPSANHAKASTSNAAQKTNTYILEESSYMALGMRLKEIQLGTVVSIFTQASSQLLLPLLTAIEGILIAAELILEELSIEIKGAVNLALYGTLPGELISLFTKFDDKIRSSVNHALEPINEALEIIKPIRALVGRLIIFYPNVIKNFEPYIDAALFNKSGYYNVNQYDTAAASILEEMEILFNDIADQLTSQKGKAIDALGYVAKDVLKNIKKLHSQVALVTLK